METFTLTLTKSLNRYKSILVILLLIQSIGAMAQTRTAYWDGDYSDDWADARNWAPQIVPDANTAVIIGDAGMLGPYSPRVYQTASASEVVRCYSVEIGMDKPVTLFVDTYEMAFTGGVTIHSNGDMGSRGAKIVVGGNWQNNGWYWEEIIKVRGFTYYPMIDFTGTATVGGTSVNNFNRVRIIGDITLTAPLNIVPLNGIYSGLFVTGILDPGTHQVYIDPVAQGIPAKTAGDSYAGLGSFIVDYNATIRIKASKFFDNYNRWPATWYENSIFDYAANGDQTVSGYDVYGILQISGSGTKSLESNTVVAGDYGVTELRVLGGTLDIGPYTMNRTASSLVTGGKLTVVDGATLRIGSTGTFPVGYATRTLGVTSTVEYYGSNQTVSNELYGNLTLSGTSTKTLPAAAMTVRGNLLGAGSASFTARGNITVNGNVTLNGTSIFNGSSFTHSIDGNWENNSTFTKGTGTIRLTGNASTTVKGTTGFNNLTIAKSAASSTVTLLSNINATNLSLTTGLLNTGVNRVVLDQGVGTISETETAYVTGTVETTRNVQAGVEQAFGGLGLKINPAVAAGTTRVTRITGTAVGVKNYSIKRTFAVMPTTNNGSLNATVAIAYFDHELNGNIESELALYRSNNGVDDWQMIPAGNTSGLTASNVVTVTGFNQFSTVTLASRSFPLPVELISFSAVKSGANALLNWTTASESESKGFEVQVSEDGYTYRAIGFVNSKSANSTLKQDYTYTDTEKSKTGTRYYRLKQTDLDGTFAYYGPRTVEFEAVAAPTVSAYPNPFSEKLSINLNATKAGTANIKLYDSVGKVVMNRSINVTAGTQQLELSTQQANQAGVYVLAIELNGQLHRIKLIKQ